MTSAQVVETSVTITENSPSQDYTHSDDQTTLLHSIFYPCNMNILPDQKTVACLVRLLKEAGGGRGRQGETGGDRGRQGETGGDRGRQGEAGGGRGRQGETGVDGINVRLSFL